MKKKLSEFLERIILTEQIFVIIAALVIGTLAGFGTLLIRAMIKEISNLSFMGDGTILENIKNTPWYLRMIIPVIGGIIVGPMLHFLAREAKRSGVPEVMQSVILRGGFIRPRVAIIKALTTSITIGTGGSVGREGPIVQIGSGIGSTIGQLFKVSSQRMKTFVGCGAAGGIAAAFNAPIAGALFAVEIILQDFAFAQFSPIVISSVMATVISHGFIGNFAEFQIPEYTLNSYSEMWFYLLMAVIMAIIAVIFIKSIYLSEDFFEKRIKLPPYLKPAIGGFLVGVIAVFFPDIMGVGYESINNALHGQTIGQIAIILVLVKIVSTSITIGSGGAGGVFAPSLFLGAMTGVYYGGVLNRFFPETAAEPGAYALVAMGGLVSAVTHAPITAIIMIFELTNNYTIILPLMLTCIVSTAIASTLSRESIYTLALVRRNVHIKTGSEINVMESLFVKDIYSKSVDTLDETQTFDQLIERLLTAKDPYFPVMNSSGQLSGVISLNNIKELLYDKDLLQDLLIVGDVAIKDVITATPQDNCQTVLQKLNKSALQGIPVVEAKDPSKLLGMIWRRDIYVAYHKEVKRRDLASSFASQIKTDQPENTVHFMEGYSLAEIAVPKSFIGKSILELDIRARFDVSIIMIKDQQKSDSKSTIMPYPDYVFTKSDTILALGEIGKINLLKSI
ncbi:MAG: chloride channel protein [Proteobacteria bacterium]|nr:chloride channel protein [Pseudomonadota bacterium]